MKQRFFGCLLFVIFAQFTFAQINLAKIEIARDTFGVPHIFAETDAEVAYGLGWAHCEDDFDHIQLMFIIAKARSGEILGKDGAIIDYYARFIKASELAEKKYEHDLSNEYKLILQSYVDAINSYASKHPKEVKLKNIFPVTTQNVIAANIVFLTSTIGVPLALESIMDGKPDEYIFNGNSGSNGFAMNQNITADSSTFLLINPHVSLEGIASWYEAHLCSNQGLNIYGALVPGMIFPVMGCNEHLGWAVTFNWPDYVDIYEMEINPENKNQYKFDDKWVDFEVRKIPLKAKTKLLKIRIKKEALWSVYGPAYRTKKGVYSLRYNTMFDVNATEQWYQMAKAQTYADFYDAMQLRAIPLFNFIMADDKSNIFYLFNASLPLRDTSYNWQKTLPGNTSKTLWNNFYSLNELPQKLNPKCGYVYNTNNSPFHCTAASENPDERLFNKQSGFYWNRINNRELRFNELMKNKSKITFEEFKKIKYDCAYPKEIGGMYKTFKPIYDLKESDYPDIADAIAKLKKWNFTGYADNKEAALVIYTFDYIFKKKKAGYNELETGIEYSTEMLVSAIRYAKKQLMRYHNSIDVSLGDVQRLIRDKKDYPVYGLPECMRSMASEDTKDGVLHARSGDSFIMFAKFSKNGNAFESDVPYGESRRKGNPHLTDQMELFAKQKTKPVILDKSTVLKTATRIYHPQ